jgi:predicted nucleic acid-binding protein
VEPVSLIVGALAAGVSETGKAAVKDAYEALKRRISALFAGKPAAEVALTEHSTDPQTWEKPLEKALAESGAANDAAVVAAAQELMRLVDEAGSRAGKYKVDLRGAHGVQVGDSNQQVNQFGTPPAGS